MECGRITVFLGYVDIVIIWSQNCNWNCTALTVSLPWTCSIGEWSNLQAQMGLKDWNLSKSLFCFTQIWVQGFIFTLGSGRTPRVADLRQITSWKLAFVCGVKQRPLPPSPHLPGKRQSHLWTGGSTLSVRATVSWLTNVYAWHATPGVIVCLTCVDYRGVEDWSKQKHNNMGFPQCITHCCQLTASLVNVMRVWCVTWCSIFQHFWTLVQIWLIFVFYITNLLLFCGFAFKTNTIVHF